MGPRSGESTDYGKTSIICCRSKCLKQHEPHEGVHCPIGKSFHVHWQLSKVARVEQWFHRGSGACQVIIDHYEICSSSIRDATPNRHGATSHSVLL